MNGVERHEFRVAVLDAVIALNARGAVALREEIRLKVADEFKDFTRSDLTQALRKHREQGSIRFGIAHGREGWMVCK